MNHKMRLPGIITTVIARKHERMNIVLVSRHIPIFWRMRKYAGGNRMARNIISLLSITV